MGIKSKGDRQFLLFTHIMLAAAAFLCLVPFYMLVIGSFTDNAEVIQHGYSFFPVKFSLDGYRYISYMADSFLTAYGITTVTTVAGTAASLFLTSSLGYGLARKKLPGRNAFSFLVVFTMLFNGGLVPTYYVYTNFINVKNSLAAYVIPGLLLSAFNVILVRSYISSSIPESLVESAELDGAGEITVYARIAMPLCTPILATIGLLVGVSYWNSWQNGLYYITDFKLYSIQNILNRMLQDIRFLQSGAMGDYGGELMAKMPTNTVRMAIAVVGVLPILVLYPFFQKYFVKGITVGAVKG